MTRLHTFLVTCTGCGFQTMRTSVERPCPQCGDDVVRGALRKARRARKRHDQVRSCGVVGVRNPAEEVETNRRLREAREAAGA